MNIKHVIRQCIQEERELHLKMDGHGTIATFKTHKEARKAFDEVKDHWVNTKQNEKGFYRGDQPYYIDID
jgi:hypothetical protein